MDTLFTSDNLIALATLTAVTQAKRVLIVLDRDDVLNWVSLRNVPQVHLIEAGQLNTYDVLVADEVVFTETALAESAAGWAAGPTVTCRAPADASASTSMVRAAALPAPISAALVVVVASIVLEFLKRGRMESFRKGDSTAPARESAGRGGSSVRRRPEAGRRSRAGRGGLASEARS